MENACKQFSCRSAKKHEIFSCILLASAPAIWYDSCKMKLHDQLVAGLLRQGFVQIESKSKYTTLTDGSRKVFVGPNGALRTGRSASDSHSIGDSVHRTAFYDFILKAGDPGIGQYE